MKKTVILLGFMAAFAQAAETPLEYNQLLSSTDGWTLGSLRNRTDGLFTIDTTAQTLSVVNSRWSQTYAVYDFGQRPVCATSDIPLSFSVTMTTADAQAYTMALIGPDKTIVIGEHYSWPPMQYAVTTTVDGTVAYGFGTWGNTGYTKVEDSEMRETRNKEANTPITISGLSSFDAEAGTYSLTLSVGDSTHTITGLDSLSVMKLSFSADGDDGCTNVVFSDLRLSGATPEPATTALSLLALAGLAARRRRH